MRKAQITRERLLTEMTGLVERQGFRPTSVNDVLQAAGIKKGTLYYHFPGKDELGLAVLERAANEFMAFLDAALTGPTPMEALGSFFDAAFERHSRTGFVGGCLWGNTALEMSDSSLAYTELVRKVFEEWIGRVERVIHSGQEAGQIRMDRSANELARLVVAGIEGGIMMSRLTKEDRPFKDCLESLRVLLMETAVSDESRAPMHGRPSARQDKKTRKSHK